MTESDPPFDLRTAPEGTIVVGTLGIGEAWRCNGGNYWQRVTVTGGFGWADMRHWSDLQPRMHARDLRVHPVRDAGPTRARWEDLFPTAPTSPP